MTTTDPITKIPYISQQNYSGVKIDINNPTVNVPMTQTPQTDYRIYSYKETELPVEYYQQLYTTYTQKVPPVLPDPKPVADFPDSVLPTRKTVSVPDPVYIEKGSSEEKFDIASNKEALPIANEVQSAEYSKSEQETSDVEIEMPIMTEVQEQDKASEIIDKLEEIPKLSETIETAQILSEDKIDEPAYKPEQSSIETKPNVIIVPPTDGKPLDYIQITENLDSENYDVQALQLKEIVDAGLEDDKSSIRPYVVEPIIHSVIDIVNKDTSTLAGPTEAQTQIRSQMMENYISYVSQKRANVPDDKITLPYNISEQDKNYANALSPLELAERNKDYGIATLALLSKTFIDRVEEETGTIVPVTDVPGLSAIVNSLKSSNFSIRLTALDALIYTQRAEYSRELTPIYEALVNTDTEDSVRAAAQYALQNLNTKQLKDDIKPEINS